MSNTGEAADNAVVGSEVTAVAVSLVGLSKPNKNGADQPEESRMKSVQVDDNNDDDDEDEESKIFNIPQKFTKCGRKRAVPFPIKLMKVLSCSDYEHIIRWTPSGKSFSIEKPKLFTAEILPLHFKTAKYSSFTRKLHRWGFMRHYRGSEAGAFFHNEFQRDRLELVEKMSCLKFDLPKSAPNTGSSLNSPSEFEDRANAIQNSMQSYNPQQDAMSEVVRMASTPTPGRANPIVNPSLSSLPGSRRSSLPTSCLPRNLDSSIDSYSRQSMESSLNFQSQIEAARSALQLPVQSLTGRLNAAIEAEVARRIEERINAAALNNALELMHQVKPLMPSPPVVPNQLLGWNQQNLTNSDALLLQQLRNREALLQASCIPNRNVQSLAAALQGMFKPPPINYAAVGSGARLNSLPPTNIQGAKTA